MPIYTRELSIPRSKMERLFIRFFRKMQVNELTTCFEWTAGKRNGYGRMIFNGRVVDVHRLMLACFYDELPRYIESAHLCHNRGCFNPSHLEPQVHVMNVRQRLSSTRKMCKYGHEYTSENQYLDKKGHRHCRQCNRESVGAWVATHRERMKEISRQSYARIGRSDRRDRSVKHRTRKDRKFFPASLALPTKS